MSAAAASIRLPKGFGAEWVKDPIDIETWPKAARRVYRFLKRRIRMRKAEHRHKDREIGQEIGEMEGSKAPHRRTVQRGLKFLQDLGGIFRDHSGGHGRVIKVLLPLAGDGKETDKEKEGAAPRERAEAGPREQARPTAAAAAAAAPPPPSSPAADPPPAAEDRRSPSEVLRAEVERIRAELQQLPEEPEAPPPLPPKRIKGIDQGDLAYLEVKEQMGELTASDRARLDALRSGRDP